MRKERRQTRVALCGTSAAKQCFETKVTVTAASVLDEAAARAAEEVAGVSEPCYSVGPLESRQTRKNPSLECCKSEESM